MKNQGVILNQKDAKSLGKYSKTGNSEEVNEILFSILMNGKAYMFEHLVTEKNVKTYTILQSEGLLEFVPEDYVKKSTYKEGDLLERGLQNRLKEMEALESEVNIPFDEAVRDKRKRQKSIVEDLQKISEEESNFIDYTFITEKNTKNFRDLIVSFSASKIKNESDVFDDFAESYSVDAFLDFLSMNLGGLQEVESFAESFDYPFSLAKKRLEDNFDFIEGEFAKHLQQQRAFFKRFEVGDESWLDKLPSKQYMRDYLNLIEARTLMQAAIEFADNESLKIRNKSINNISKTLEMSEVMDNANDRSHFVFQLVIDEIGIPELKTIDDLLKYRESKNIKEFIKMVNIWNEAIQANELHSIEKLKRHLIKANNALPDLKKKEQWTTWFTRSCSVFGYAHSVPAGIIATSIVSMIDCHDYVQNKKYKWLLVDH